MGWQVASLVLILPLLSTALPPDAAKTKYYKDNQGNYNINYKVETDKGLISVRQHHHNLGAVDPVVKPVKEDIPPPVELELLPVAAKYGSPRGEFPSRLPLEDRPVVKGKFIDTPKYIPVRHKPLPPSEEVYLPPPLPKYVPSPPKYVSVRPAYPGEDEYCPPEEGVPPPVPKYESVRHLDDSYSPPPAKDRSYDSYPDAVDRTYDRAKVPFKRNVLSRAGDLSSDGGVFEMPKELKDKLYSMGLLYMKNLWGNV